MDRALQEKQESYEALLAYAQDGSEQAAGLANIVWQRQFKMAIPIQQLFQIQ